MSGFRVINPGIQSSIQDEGRKGYGSIGVTQAGAVDEFAFHWSNKLLGNQYNTNALEIGLGGIKLKAEGSIDFVLTGAVVEVSIDGRKIASWKTHTIKDGEVLDIGFASSGQRMYLGVVGGFDVSPEYDSYSVSIKEGIGGLPLKRNDFLPYTCRHLNERRKLLNYAQPDYDKPLTLRVIAGYQWELFSEDERQKFFTSAYKVTPQNDRMGYRLEGQKIKAQSDGIVSEAIAYGSIQIPSHGEPIVLLKERQTIGGYPKIGSVIAVDCFKLSQMQQGSMINFSLVSKEEARNSCINFYNFFKI